MGNIIYFTQKRINNIPKELIGNTDFHVFSYRVFMKAFIITLLYYDSIILALSKNFCNLKTRLWGGFYFLSFYFLLFRMYRTHAFLAGHLPGAECLAQRLR